MNAFIPKRACACESWQPAILQVPRRTRRSNTTLGRSSRHIRLNNAVFGRVFGLCIAGWTLRTKRLRSDSRRSRRMFSGARKRLAAVGGGCRARAQRARHRPAAHPECPARAQRDRWPGCAPSLRTDTRLRNGACFNARHQRMMHSCTLSFS